VPGSKAERITDVPEFQSQDVAIAYESFGDGDPVLLIHGFASTGRINWIDTGWVDLLVKSGRRAIVMDNRGHGRSAKLYDPADYGANIMAEDAAGLLRHLGIARADIMGYSMGARICAFLAIGHARQVRSVIFGGLGEAMMTGVPGSENVARALEAGHPDEIANKDALAFRLFADANGADRRALAACIRSSRVRISADMLGRITAPVLVAVGETDAIAGRPEPLAEVLADGRAVVIPRRDHMRATGDKVFKQAVLDFLAPVA
jgi:pimeloyl-ACP methyl ester carboxylesterase